MLILVTGGAASGKSAFAERLLCEKTEGKHLYVATMQPFGEQAQERIARHHRLRAGCGFDTVERYRDLHTLAVDGQYDGVLLEDLGNLLANEQFSTQSHGAEDRVTRGVMALCKQCHMLVAVTNEIFADGVQYPAQTRRYAQALARVNQTLGAQADAVLEVVCGIAVALKGGNRL